MRKKSAVISVIVLGILATLTIYNNRIRIFREFYFEKVGDNLFVSKNTPISRVNDLKIKANVANRKNAVFWGEDFTEVDIYYLDNEELQANFSNVDDLATTITTLLYNYVVINRNGLNENIISHEICHSILYDNLGVFKWYKHKYVVPIWFDEGLALQLDDREDFKLDKWNYQPDIKPLAYLIKIDNESDYYNINKVYDNYMMSKLEVANWLNTHKLKDLTSKIRFQGDFYAAYQYRRTLK